MVRDELIQPRHQDEHAGILGQETRVKGRTRGAFEESVRDGGGGRDCSCNHGLEGSVGDQHVSFENVDADFADADDFCGRGE